MLKNDGFVQKARANPMLHMLFEMHRQVTLHQGGIEPFKIVITDIQQDEKFALEHSLKFMDPITSQAWLLFKASSQELIGSVHIEPLFWSSIFFNALCAPRKNKGTIVVPNGCCNSQRCGITKFYFILASCWNNYCSAVETTK